MTHDLFILHAQDSERLVLEFANLFGSKVSLRIICVNSAPAPRLQQRARVKVHVLFFSPEFLRFLEERPSDAYYMCGHLECGSTLALFCLGLRARDVLCYHTAPLHSFASWGKFEIPSSDSAFPQELLNQIQEVVGGDLSVDADIAVVPQSLKRHNRVVHVIFSCPTEEVKDVNVHLKDQKEVDIHLEQVNPYVLKFSVPDCLFNFSHNVCVTVGSGSRVLCKQSIHLSQDTPKHVQAAEEKPFHPPPSTQEEMLLDEQLKFLEHFSRLTENEDDFTSIMHPENLVIKPQKQKGRIEIERKTREFDLKKLCRQYGLENLSLLVSDPPSLSTDDESHSTLQEPAREKGDEVSHHHISFLNTETVSLRSRFS
ncbi:DBB domain-containing protein [Caerostris darwini]|uniref:DBB domain-containing protein n=1 Tax=Caerostris darwini TaxID=1538125 RepID=A0AAV4U5N5_9ARAC|nr:DBB domain-containing protein [Caerostris darwini]